MINTVIFLVVAINIKMMIALYLSGFFLHTRWWIKLLAVLFILPWAVPSIPTILSVRFMLNPEWGVINSAYLPPHRPGRPELAERPDAGAEPVDADAHLEVATVLDVDLAGRAHGDTRSSSTRPPASTAPPPGRSSRFITWPSMSGLYLTSTLLSTIWTLGDFNSVYLLTGGGPADLTHVLATLGIRYLRLDQIELAMASIVVSMPLVLPIVYFMMKRLSQMKLKWSQSPPKPSCC